MYARCESPKHKTEHCPIVELEKMKLSGTKSVGSKARERGRAAKEVEVDFSEDNSGSDQSNRTEIGFMMCNRVTTEANGGEQEEHGGALLTKWNEKHCMTRHCISKEDMDKE